MRLLGASWAILASEVRPGRRLRPVLGAFWSRHGAYWGRLWGALGGVLRLLGVSQWGFGGCLALVGFWWGFGGCLVGLWWVFGGSLVGLWWVFGGSGFRSLKSNE